MKKKIIIPISIVVLIIIFIVSFSMCSSSNSQDYYENDDFSETDGFTEDNEIEDNISSVGNETLQYPSENDEWEYDVYETYITLKKYKGNSKTVNIPSEIENKPVKSIGSKCFTICPLFGPVAYLMIPPIRRYSPVKSFVMISLGISNAS